MKKSLVALVAATLTMFGMLVASSPVMADDASRITVWAFGDSFVSGVGNTPYDTGTDVSENHCQRSTHAWPYKMMHRLSKMQLVAFTACAGAITDNLWQRGQYNEPPQIEAISGTPQAAIGMIGGNDIGFGAILQGCLGGHCDEAIAAAKQKIAALPDVLLPAMQHVRDKITTDGALDVLYYPYLVADPSTAVQPCYWNPAIPQLGTISPETMTKLRALTDDLNHSIADVVEHGPINGRVVDTTKLFAGHELCGKKELAVFPVDPSSDRSLHPNALGTRLLSRIAAKTLRFEFELDD